MIFKQGSCADELFDGMQNAQQESLLEESQHNEKLVCDAMESLNHAAKCFERIGRKVRAEEVTAVMVSLADSKEPELVSDKSSLDEAAKVFEFLGFKPDDFKACQ